MVFTFSLVYARAFGNRQIWSLWKKYKLLITLWEELIEDFWGQFWTFSFFHHFNTKVYIFLQHFVETFPGLRFGRSSFLIIIIFIYCTHRKLTSSFQNCKFILLFVSNGLKPLSRSYLESAHHACYYTSRKIGGPKILPVTHPPIHTSGQRFSALRNWWVTVFLKYATKLGRPSRGAHRKSTLAPSLGLIVNHTYTFDVNSFNSHSQ